MEKEIDILIVEPGKAPRPARVKDTLETFQKIVGGPIEAGCYLPQRVMLICNGEGKNLGLPINRIISAGSANGAPAEAQRSGFGGERRGKVTKRSFPLQRETERSGFRPDAIAGTFFLCGFEGEHFASLTPAQQKEFQEHFAAPGEFMMVGTDTICANPGELLMEVCKLWERMNSGESILLTKWGGTEKGEPK